MLPRFDISGQGVRELRMAVRMALSNKQPDDKASIIGYRKVMVRDILGLAFYTFFQKSTDPESVVELPTTHTEEMVYQLCAQFLSPMFNDPPKPAFFHLFTPSYPAKRDPAFWIFIRDPRVEDRGAPSRSFAIPGEDLTPLKDQT